MVRFTPSDIAFIKANFDNHEELVHASKVEDILFPLERLILLKGYQDNYEDLNAFGQKALQVRDNIYYNN